MCLGDTPRPLPEGQIPSALPFVIALLGPIAGRWGSLSLRGGVSCCLRQACSPYVESTFSFW